MKMRKIRYVQLGLILAFTLIVGTCLPPLSPGSRNEVCWIRRLWRKRKWYRCPARNG